MIKVLSLTLSYAEEEKTNFSGSSGPMGREEEGKEDGETKLLRQSLENFITDE